MDRILLIKGAWVPAYVGIRTDFGKALLTARIEATVKSNATVGSKLP